MAARAAENTERRMPPTLLRMRPSAVKASRAEFTAASARPDSACRVRYSPKRLTTDTMAVFMRSRPGMVAWMTASSPLPNAVAAGRSCSNSLAVEAKTALNVSAPLAEANTSTSVRPSLPASDAVLVSPLMTVSNALGGIAR